MPVPVPVQKSGPVPCLHEIIVAGERTQKVRFYSNNKYVHVFILHVFYSITNYSIQFVEFCSLKIIYYGIKE